MLFWVWVPKKTG